jgi:hypothetical protein
MKIRKKKQRKKPTVTKVAAVKVSGAPRPRLPPGPRKMTCIRCDTIENTRHGTKIRLYWRDPGTGIVLIQYFPLKGKSLSSGSKAFSNYCVAMERDPSEVEEINLAQIVGLRAIVHVETVVPKYAYGALAGEPKPQIFHYSKVGEIIRPLERV